jgi:NAD(P)-dependent dehydrogenase (short-subunit alcohol dehydrogenase family)
MRLKDKVAIITGAAQGIGLAIAERLAAEGAAVVMADRNREAGEVEVRRLAKGGARASFVACDVADAGAGKLLVDAALKAHGSLDICVNNAAVIDNAHFLDLDLPEFDRVLSVNLRAYFIVGQAAARQMAAQIKSGGKPGSIINMSSVQEHFGLPDHVAYTVAKGGVRQLTRAMAIALAPIGIRVNAIGPGTIATPLINNVITTEDFRRRVLSRTPLGRVGEPSEVASIAAFLASEDASYVTGETIYCDGGRIPLNYTVAV